MCVFHSKPLARWDGWNLIKFPGSTIDVHINQAILRLEKEAIISVKRRVKRGVCVISSNEALQLREKSLLLNYLMEVHSLISEIIMHTQISRLLNQVLKSVLYKKKLCLTEWVHGTFGFKIYHCIHLSTLISDFKPLVIFVAYAFTVLNIQYIVAYF